MLRKVSSFIILFLFLIVTACAPVLAKQKWNSSIISHEMRVKVEEHYPPIPNPDHHLTSLPEGMGNSPLAIAVIFSREIGVWDEEFVYLGAWKFHSEEMREKARKRIELLKYIVDGTFPDEPMVSMGFFILENDLIIYFEPDKWKDREFHENAAKKINEKLMEYEGTK